MAYYDHQALQNVTNSWEYSPDQTITFHEPNQNNIVLFAGGTEMLKVADDGFYVRGVKIEQDDKEAERVYNAFKAFLMWAELNRR